MAKEDGMIEFKKKESQEKEKSVILYGRTK